MDFGGGQTFVPRDSASDGALSELLGTMPEGPSGRDFGHVVACTMEDVRRESRIPDKPSFETGWDFFQNTKVSELFPLQLEDTHPTQRRKLITVLSDTPIAEAFRTLSENKILSAPLYNASGRGAAAELEVRGTTPGYVGFIDMLDIVSHFVAAIEEAAAKGQSFRDLLSRDRTLTAGSVAGRSPRNKWYPVDASGRLSDAVRAIAQERVHRVPVLDSAGQLVTVLSQSLIVELIDKHIDKFDFPKYSLRRLRVGFKGSVISITTEQSTLDAFKLIHEKQVGGVAVVDPDGRLVGNISASDLRAIGYDHDLIPLLNASAGSFIASFSQTPVTVTPDASLAEAVFTARHHNVHRVWIVDEHEHPIGVISLTDIIETFAEGAT